MTPASIPETFQRATEVFHDIINPPPYGPISNFEHQAKGVKEYIFDLNRKLHLTSKPLGISAVKVCAPFRGTYSKKDITFAIHAYPTFSIDGVHLYAGVRSYGRMVALLSKVKRCKCAKCREAAVKDILDQRGIPEYLEGYLEA